MKLLGSILAVLFLFTATQSFATNIDQVTEKVAYWTDIAVKKYKEKGKSAEISTFKVMISETAVTVTFLLPDRSSVSLSCMNMSGKDMCM